MTEQLSGEHRRKARKEELIEVIKEKKEDVEKKLIANLSLKWGLTPKTIGEYIDELIDADLVIRTHNGKEAILKWKSLEQ